MKIILFFDQIQGGYGGKENRNHPLTIDKGGTGSATILEPSFKKIGGEIIATISCGDLYFAKNEEQNAKKIAAMAKKLGADIVFCGPCYNYEDYGTMAAKVCQLIREKTSVVALTAMSKENEKTIEEYKDSIPIVKMPKKGGTHLTEAIENVADAMDHLMRREEVPGEYLYGNSSF